MGEITNRKRIVAGVAILAVIVVVAFFVVIFFTAPPSPLFTVMGKQQPTESVGGGYKVISWNFTFVYNGRNTLQNVNLYLNNGDMAFKSVPEVPEGWVYEYLWTPGDVSANATITISWQHGAEYYEFQP